MKASLLLGAALVTPLAACALDLGIDGAPSTTKKCGTYFDQRECVALAVSTDVPAILKGDVVRVTALSDSGFATNVTWTSTAGVAFVGGSERSDTVIFYGPASSIAVRGMIGGGNATIRATSSDGQHSAFATLWVADSSSVNRFYMTSYAPAANSGFIPTTTVHAGDSLWVNVMVTDSLFHTFNVTPLLAVSDTTIARLVERPGPPPSLYPRFWLVAKKPGSVDLVASFLAASGRLGIAVIP